MNATTLKIPSIQLKDDKLTTTSLDVAEFFGRRHKNVIQKIESLGAPQEFSELNFKPVEYTDLKGESRKSYEMTRDGFTVLVMGFTGEKAMVFKIGYIEEFNKMETELLQKYKQAAIPANFPETIDPKQKLAIRDGITKKVYAEYDEAKRQVGFSKVYHDFYESFGISKYGELPVARFPDAMAYLVGEYVPETQALPPVSYHYPIETARPTHKLDDVLNTATLLDERYESPLSHLLRDLNEQGHDINGAIIELKAMRHTIELNHLMFSSIQSSIQTGKENGLNFNTLAANAADCTHLSFSQSCKAGVPA